MRNWESAYRAIGTYAKLALRVLSSLGVSRRLPVVIAYALVLLFGLAACPALGEGSQYRYVYISAPNGVAHQHPTQLRFSDDGDLIGMHLRWRKWGASSSTASGLFTFRLLTTARLVTLKGTVTAYGREPYCMTAPKTAFYDKVRFNVPGAPWPMDAETLGAPKEGTECILE
jgi:hypothetical protein